jgi:hypothetical protein
MQMRMMLQILTPGMEQDNEANLGSQVLGSRCDRAQGLGGGVKQDVVDHGLILIRNRGDRLRQRKDDMEVFNGKEVGLAIFQPLRTDQGLAFRTVPIATTVVGNALMTAAIALLNMAAESDSTATLDRAHDTALSTAKGLSVFLAVGRTSLAKDVRHLEPGGMHHAPQK